VIFLYSSVGVLFIAAAALFYFFKEGTCRYFYRENRKRHKALSSLIVMSGLLIVFFVPVFSSYNSADQKKIESMTSPSADSIN